METTNEKLAMFSVAEIVSVWWQDIYYSTGRWVSETLS